MPIYRENGCVYTLTYNCTGCCLIVFDDINTVKNIEANTIIVNKRHVKHLIPVLGLRTVKCEFCGQYLGKKLNNNQFEIKLNKVIRVRVTT